MFVLFLVNVWKVENDKQLVTSCHLNMYITYQRRQLKRIKVWWFYYSVGHYCILNTYKQPKKLSSLQSCNDGAKTRNAKDCNKMYRVLVI
jgi:hypothetical protein